MTDFDNPLRFAQGDKFLKPIKNLEQARDVVEYIGPENEDTEINLDYVLSKIEHASKSTEKKNIEEAKDAVCIYLENCGYKNIDKAVKNPGFY